MAYSNASARLVALGSVALLVVAACGGDDEPTPAGAAGATHIQNPSKGGASGASGTAGAAPGGGGAGGQAGTSGQGGSAEGGAAGVGGDGGTGGSDAGSEGGTAGASPDGGPGDASAGAAAEPVDSGTDVSAGGTAGDAAAEAEAAAGGSAGSDAADDAWDAEADSAAGGSGGDDAAIDASEEAAVEAGAGGVAGDDAGVDASGGAAGSDSGAPVLFFSEYVEGTSNNKALEIYNASADAYDIGNCVIHRYMNGATSPTTPSLTFESAMVAAGGVWVICNTQIAGVPDGVCKTFSGNLNFNGNDALELVCGGVTMDVFGQIGAVVTSWGTAPTATLDTTLTRKCSVTAGDVNGADAFDPATEWEGHAVNSFQFLGSRNCP